tara:strand:+ start:946 stop:1062 length:117 start_codon:yes stop_codon:yes gene_type:complete
MVRHNGIMPAKKAIKKIINDKENLIKSIARGTQVSNII